VAPHMDRLCVQAYSVRNRTKKNLATGKYDVPWAVPWTHTYGPGRMQVHTLDRTSLVPGDPKIVAGLAAYDQKWPTHLAHTALSMAYDAAISHEHVEVVAVRYWSSKWVLGVRNNRYASKFLKSLVWI